MMDADEALKAAAQHSWEAALLVTIVVSAFVFIGWMLRQILKESREREARMASRIDKLEEAENATHKHYNEQLSTLTSSVTAALVKSTETQGQLITTMSELTTDMRELCSLLRSCPCLLLKDRREAVKILDKNNNVLATLENGHDE